MTHGDDNGLALPPAVAPIQAVIIPIAAHKGGVMETALKLKAQLESTVPGCAGRQRQFSGLEVCAVRDEGRTRENRAWSAGYRKRRMRYCHPVTTVKRRVVKLNRYSAGC